MSFAKAENKAHQADAKTKALPSSGDKGISMPAVPVLQNQPTQLQSASEENPAQMQVPVELQRQYADKDQRENIQPFQLVAQPSPPANQPTPNSTGLPDELKKGVESLSGFDISDVKVHYNSPKPAQLQAFAYAQGTDIQVAPGQEKHIPHEAWHVVQQKQGRVQPTVQLKDDVPVNDDHALEQEATVMGSKAAQLKSDEITPLQLKSYSGSTGVVQRYVENDKIEDPESDHGKIAVAFAKHVNDLAQEAYRAAINVPGLGPYAGLDGHTELWKEKWNSYLTTRLYPPLMAATFGYVVESFVSNILGPFRPTPPGGCTVYYQVISGGTRPDLVLKDSSTSKDIIWIDLTASASGGHIFLKDNWDKKVSRYAEVTYPSISLSTIAQMVGNKDNTVNLTQEEFEKKKKEVELAYALRKAQWKKWGAKYMYSTLRSEIDYSTDTLNLIPSLKQAFIKNRLQKDFDVDAIDWSLVPSILAAMDVGPGPWGFTTGTSATKASGEAWLTDNDPTAPNVTPSATPKDKEEKKTPSKSTTDAEGTNEVMKTEED